jgi:hypothetical protein
MLISSTGLLPSGYDPLSFMFPTLVESMSLCRPEVNKHGGGVNDLSPEVTSWYAITLINMQITLIDMQII